MAGKTHQDLESLLAADASVRRLARALAAADGDDVAQEAWLLALQQRTALPAPRRWLLRVARNLAANLRRGARRRGEREQRAAVPERAPSSVELMLREERRAALVRAVDRLPAELREVVLLRWFEQLPPRRIAVVLKLPVTTVWNRLRSALQLLRARLEGEHGDGWRAWLWPFPVGAPRPPVPETPTCMPVTLHAGPLATGAILMLTKTKIAAGACALLLLAAWAVWPARQPLLQTPRPKAPTAAVAAVDTPTGNVANDATEAIERQPVAVASSGPAPTTGTLVVHALRGEDRSPAAGEQIVVLAHAESSLLGTRSLRTDADGNARIEDLAAGQVDIHLPQHPQRTAAIVAAGAITEVAFVLPDGMTVHGVVVDANEQPIAGAEVELSSIAYRPVHVATTVRDGTFTIGHVYFASAIGARAPGWAASRRQLLMGGDGVTVDVRIQLVDPGGSVEGVVAGPDGRPVAGAIVRVGEDIDTGMLTSVGMPATAVPVRTDAEGRFCAVGLAPGEQPVAVRARGLAPWHGSCFVTASLTTPLHVVLAAGVTVTGSVHDANGAPAGGVEVTTGRGEDLSRAYTETAADGSFMLSGLAAGDIELHAEHSGLGKARAVLRGEPGATVQCTLQLSRGIELHGCLLDADGKGVADTMCLHMGVGPMATAPAPPSRARMHRVASCCSTVPWNR